LILLAARTAGVVCGKLRRFLGKVDDEWIGDTPGVHPFQTASPHRCGDIAFVLIRLLRLVTARMVASRNSIARNKSRVAQVRTLASVIRATGLAVIFAITALQFLAAMGVNLAPLLASAGVAGVAIGLAAQSLVKDVLNGISILIEDQFDVGDMVRLAGPDSVTVEAMTLRKTTVRDGDGTLFIIPNSQITTVANQSRGYSVATVNISVDFSANPDKVQEILRNIAMEIRNSKEYKQLFLADPQILGVDCDQRVATHLSGPSSKPGPPSSTRRCGSPAARASGARRAPHAARRSQPDLQCFRWKQRTLTAQRPPVRRNTSRRPLTTNHPQPQETKSFHRRMIGRETIAHFRRLSANREACRSIQDLRLESDAPGIPATPRRRESAAGQRAPQADQSPCVTPPEAQEGEARSRPAPEEFRLQPAAKIEPPPSCFTAKRATAVASRRSASGPEPTIIT